MLVRSDAMTIVRSLIRLVGCASVAAALFLSPHALADVPKRSQPGVYEGYSQERFDEWVKSSQYVTMRDGVRLAVDIYRPARDGRAVDEKFPVVWVHTPYRRAFRDANGEVVPASDALLLLPLIKHGYVIAVVDTRGRGASFGARRGFQDRTEALDAYEMTEWLAKQPWSTGAVGIAGCSYVGGSAYHAATTMPPHLRAVAAGCTDFDKYGFVSRGGITAQFNTRPENPEQDFGQGVLPVDEDTDGSLVRAAIEAHKRGTPMAELWRGMRYRDDVSPLLGVPFWKEASVATYIEEIERSGVGLFIWGNWFDEGSFEAILAFNNLRNPRKLWMGSWGHCQTGDFPMSIELLRFFDHFLKGVDNGWDREPPIYFRTTNAEPGKEWRTAERWPLPEARTHTLRLAGQAKPGEPGLLTASTTSTGGADAFTVDYSPKCANPQDAYFMMWPCVIDNHGLSYVTAPLARDAHIAGHPVADIWMSATTPDADLFVYLEDVAPNGAITIVTHGRLRASHRGEQSPPYRDYMGLPYHSGERAAAEPLVPGEPARMRLDLLPTSTIIKAGHRLRLTVAGADPRQRTRNVQFNPPPTIHILHDAALHVSQLSLPVLGALEFEESAASDAPGG
nr:peptidase S15 [Gammaproteobacteria bacterium]